MTALAEEADPSPEAGGVRHPRWTIPWVMQVVAIAAGLLTIARVPVAFGGFLMAIPIIQYVIVAIKGRRYGRLAGLLCLAPALPLLAFYLRWGALGALSLAAKPPFQDWFGECTAGMILPLLALMPLGVLAYLACMMLAMYAKKDSTLWHASIWTFVAMPIAWTGLLALAAWDPFDIETTMISLFILRIFSFV